MFLYRVPHCPIAPGKEYNYYLYDSPCNSLSGFVYFPNSDSSCIKSLLEQSLNTSVAQACDTLHVINYRSFPVTGGIYPS